MATIEGSSNADTLLGSSDADTILGFAGDDTIFGSELGDSIDGGDDYDTVDYHDSASAVVVNLATGTGSGGDAGGDSYTSIEGAVGSALADVITGNGAANFLDGGDGNDTIAGGLGGDILIGGTGIDTADYTSSVGDVRVSLALGTGTRNAAQGDVLSGIENITGSAFNDSLTGDTGNNLLTGLDGNDSLLGGDGADTLIGGTGTTDSMTGGNGDDIYYVDSTTDKISEGSTGGTGDLVYSSASYTLSLNVEDLILTGTGDLNATGNSGANAITGTVGNNALAGGSGNDALYGGDGNDALNGGSGVDAMTGGQGDDSYFLDNLLDTVTESAGEGHDTVNSTVAWTLGTDFEDLTLTGSTGAAGTGNASNNVINGNIGSNLLTGLDGDDSMVGDLTTDTLAGGNDTLDGGAGENTLIGGLGNDTYIVTTGTDTVIEALNGGTDVVQSAISLTLAGNVENLVLTGLSDLAGTGNGLANILTGNDGANLLVGGGEADTLNGGIGNDTLDGGFGIDSLVGGTGDDDYIVDDATDKMIEGSAAGTDQVFASVSFTLTANIERLFASGTNAIDLTGNTLDNLIEGNDNANILSGSTGADTLTALDGNDTLNGGVGIDFMTGGAGDDVYIVDDALDLTVEDLANGADLVQSSINWTLADNVETLILTGTSGLSGTGNTLANSISGTTAANALNGLAGSDTLIGDAGNDSLNGGLGIDSMIGGIGDDIYTLSSIDDILVEDLSAGVDLVRAAFSYVLGDNLDNLTLTGTGDLNGTGNGLANVLTGTVGANVLSGLDGDDTLVAGSGADTLIGGTGADSMSGGAGADLYYVDNAGDKVIETSVTQIDTVVSSVSFTLGSYVENLALVSGIIDGTGNSVANILTGTTSANVLSGLGGNDTLNGLAGNDTLDGGIGNDTMNGGNDNDVYIVNALADVVNEAGTTGTDRVDSSVNYILGTGLENLTLTGVNRINGTGNTDANLLVGNASINKLTGLEGDDTLTGDDGADRFIFNSTVSGLDTITDFNGLVSGVADGDKLELAASLLVGTFAYVGAGAFSGGLDNSEARVNINLGRVVIDTDGDGTGDIIIALTGLTLADQLTITDFVFV